MNSHDAMLDSVAVYALGALPPEEAKLVRAHLDECEACRAEYRDLAPAAAALAYAAETSPDPQLKARIMARVRPDAPKVRALRPMWPAYAAAACVALAIGSAVYDVSLNREIGALRVQNAQASTALAELAAPDAHRYRIAGGEVVRRGSHLLIAMNALPPPPKGKVYQAWTLPNGATEMVPSVTFVPNGNGMAIVALPVNASNLAAVAVSVEPAGGSKQPTSKPTFVLKFS